MQLLIYLYDGAATVLDGNDVDARNLIREFDSDWERWPQDLDLYDQGDGFLILDAEYDADNDEEPFKNPKFSRMTENQFHLIQTYGTIWFE